MIEVKIIGKNHVIPNGVFNKRDLSTQIPPQSYESIWRRFVKPGDVVFDIGAYVGLISLHFAALGGVVHAFEGSPRNFPRLKRMAQEFKAYKIATHQVALSDENQTIKTRFNDCVDREHPLQEIQYARLEDYMACYGLPDPNFVKMDIEGMETVALKAMTRLIHEVRPVWQIECHVGIPFKYDGYPGHVGVQDGGFDFEEFERAGYVIIDENKKVTKAKNMKCFNNYFFISHPRQKPIFL